MTPIMPSPVIAPSSDAPQERMIPAVADIAAVVVPTVASQSSAASRLGNLLDVGIKKLDSLGHTPLSVPTAIVEQPPVPIDVLLYRGRAAIERCVQIRDDARIGGGSPDGDALAELLDLLDLALTD